MPDEGEIEDLNVLKILTITWDESTKKGVVDVSDVGVSVALMLLHEAIDSLEILTPRIDVRIDSDTLIELSAIGHPADPDAEGDGG